MQELDEKQRSWAMKKITRYEDVNGNIWETEKEAILSDHIIAIQNHMNPFAKDIGNFDIWAFIYETKNKPQIIKHILGVLEVDLTKIQAEKLLK